MALYYANKKAQDNFLNSTATNYLTITRNIIIVSFCVLILSLTGCKSEYGYHEICDCTEPLDNNPGEGDDGDDHESFDFEISNVSKSPSDIYELQDIEFSWDLDYHWEDCKSITIYVTGPFWNRKVTGIIETSTPGHSGDVPMRYNLKDLTTSEILWEGVITLNSQMGYSGTPGVTFDGVEVDGTDTTDVRQVIFSVYLEPTAEQECPDDLPNEGSVQFIVNNCPCSHGDRSRDFFPSGLSWSEKDLEFCWTNNYAWGRCGREEDELTEETGSYNEVISVYSSSGTLLHTETHKGISVPLNDNSARCETIEELKGVSTPYTIQIELRDINPDVDCRGTHSKTENITVF